MLRDLFQQQRKVLVNQTHFNSTSANEEFVFGDFRTVRSFDERNEKAFYDSITKTYNTNKTNNTNNTNKVNKSDSDANSNNNNNNKNNKKNRGRRNNNTNQSNDMTKINQYNSIYNKEFYEMQLEKQQEQQQKRLFEQLKRQQQQQQHNEENQKGYWKRYFFGNGTFSVFKKNGVLDPVSFFFVFFII